MSSRLADNESEFALWRIKRARTGDASRRVLIAHKDKSIGDSLAVQLRLKGLQVIHSQDMKSVRALVHSWQPQALLLDTRLDNDSGYVFLRTLRMDADVTGRLGKPKIAELFDLDHALAHVPAILERALATS